MKFFGYDVEIGKKSVTAPSPVKDIGDVSINPADSGILKAFVPEFLYKPPFGYPRKENLPLLRQLAKNPYVYSVVKALCDEAASCEFDITYKENVEPTPQLDSIREEILTFLRNPNRNKESFKHIIRAVVKDIAEVDSGVIIKVFNRKGEMSQLFARDGASFLKNPDMYGYLGNRSEYVKPLDINYAVTPESPDWSNKVHQYGLQYKDAAAYFQYGTTAMALPVPFGRREVIYINQNPRSDSIYGLSPIQILADVITTLVYGANYNLDFYMNNNMPEGIITLLGADSDQLKAFRERMDKQFRIKDEVTGFTRKTAFKYPIVNQQAEFKSFQLDPKVMQIVEQQSWFTKLVWACYGVNADEMGFTEDSNRATGENQSKAYKRKAVRPILELLAYHFENEIIAEWGEEAYKSFDWKWDDYDIEEELKKHDLYQKQVTIGMKTAEMIAEEEGVDVAELKVQKEEQRNQRMEEAAQGSFNNFSSKLNEEKSIARLKALGIEKDTRVKVTSPGPHAGKIGTVEYTRFNGEEDIFMVRFRDGMDLFFFNELKVVAGGVADDEIVPSEMEDEPVAPDNVEDTKGLKAEKFDNELERELVLAIKSRGKELVKAIDQYKHGELDKIQ